MSLFGDDRAGVFELTTNRVRRDAAGILSVTLAILYIHYPGLTGFSSILKAEEIKLT